MHLHWTGNQGEGTANYRAYSRDHEVHVPGKPMIPASSDPSFRGDPTRYNPEELLVASLSGCHMLWYLHLCSVNGIVVAGYEDHSIGSMIEATDGSGQFEYVVLRPKVHITDPSRIEDARKLHGEASKMCFIARSVNFPVRHEPEMIAS